jgi:hypothetical protein
MERTGGSSASADPVNPAWQRFGSPRRSVTAIVNLSMRTTENNRTRVVSVGAVTIVLAQFQRSLQ